MEEVWKLSAREQAVLIRERRMSVRELVESHIRRTERIDPEVGAFITVAPEYALREAERADRAVAEYGDLSPLHGVPTAVKDLNFVSGLRTTFGSSLFTSFVPDADDNVTSLIRGAGMVITGKTNTPEFGTSCYTEPEVAAPARCPWDFSRSAGGSSGGAAAAVAAGLIPVAHGSDAAGSIRIPASACGVVGFKPTRGRISSGPVLGDTAGFYTNGVLARGVLDAAALLDVMAVPLPGDPLWQPVPDTAYVRQAQEAPPPLRVARYCTPALPEADVADECRRGWEVVSRSLEDLGHTVEDIPCPFPRDTAPLFQTLYSVTAAALPLGPDQEEGLRPITRWLRERGADVSGAEAFQTITAAQQAARRAAAATEGFDLMLTPTLARLPAPLGSLRDDTDPAAEFERQKHFSPFAAPYNLTGQPAISLPLHWSPEGLPVGVMLAGAPGRDGLLLSVAHQLEQAHPWAHMRPPVG